MRKFRFLTGFEPKEISKGTTKMGRADVDFGFSLVDEDDLRNTNYEKELEDKLQVVDLTAAEYKKRLLQTRDLVMPLLEGLTKNPEKKGLLWPSRSQKCKELIRKINDVVGDAK